ncbi:MAG: metallophosphoesterase [Myxococcales bacterium]|nr:metallophosphoesterase [Myxococcales bacterium]
MSDAAKILIVSDLHLGNGGSYDIFAGGESLPALLRTFAQKDHTVIFNGDSVDFLMNEDPLELDEARAVHQAEQTFAAPATAAVLHALGEVLAAGGDVVIRIGNHDIELALDGVQQRMRAALRQPPEIAARLRFERGEKPAILTVGGARILVTHGEQNDSWNKVDYLHLPGPGAAQSAHTSDFTYSAGSRLVKTIMNPLKRLYGLRLIDLIKPDFQGGVLTALAISPTAVKEVFKGSTVQLLWQLREQSRGPNTFAPEEGGQELGLQAAIDSAGLDDEERATMAALLADSTRGAATFDLDTSVLQSAQLKLARSGLRMYAGAQRRLAKDEGKKFYELVPDEAEWSEAQRLAKKFNVGAVIFGHSHAARWQQKDGLAYLNTGTWIRLIKLPAADASDEAWTDFLTLARKNPQLDPSKGEMVPIFTRLSAAIITPIGTHGGAKLELAEWKDGTLQIEQSGTIPSQEGEK